MEPWSSDERLGAWDVTDSSELPRTPAKHLAELRSPSAISSREGLLRCSADDLTALEKAVVKKSTTAAPVAAPLEAQNPLTVVCKNRRPPRSPRTANRSLTTLGEPAKLELTVQSLSPRLPASVVREQQPKALENNSRPRSASCHREKARPVSSSSRNNQTKAKDGLLKRLSSEEPLKSVSYAVNGQEVNLFSGIDMENHSYMLTDDSEADFWDCKEDQTHGSTSDSKELQAMLLLEESTRNGLPLDEDAEAMNSSTTICTLNGELVIMQTNLTFQHESGYAQASEEYLRSQQHMINYLEDQSQSTEPEDESGGLEVKSSFVSLGAKAEVSSPGKRRWPKLSKNATTNQTGGDTTRPLSTDACLSARQCKAASRRTKHLGPAKRNVDPARKQNSWSMYSSAVNADSIEAEASSEAKETSESTGSLSKLNQEQETDKQEEVVTSTGQVTEEPPTEDIAAAITQEPDRALNKEVPEEEKGKEEVNEGKSKEEHKQQKDLEERRETLVDFGERSSLSKEKFCSILSFLKQVEETNMVEVRTGRSMLKVLGDDHSPRTVLEQDDAISLAESTFTSGSMDAAHRPKTSSADTAFSGIRKKIHELKDTIAKQNSRIADLEAEKQNLKVENMKELSSEKARYSRELQDQAAEYKAGIKKQLTISEKLMRDKEALSEKISTLTSSLNTAEAKFEEKMKAAKEQWSADVKKQKEAWNAGEKARREAWIEKKTKEIKEMTIVGLEPHIESIHECHKKELQALEKQHMEELARQLQKQVEKHRQEMSGMREQLLKERDEMLDKERLAAHSRLNEMAEKYEQQALQQRMRIANDLALQLERSEAARRDDKQYTQELLARFQKEAAEREEAFRKKHERALEDVQAQCQAELSALVARMDSERAQWRKTLDERVSAELVAREQVIQAKCLKERNQEIEVILDRLEREKDEAIDENSREKMSRINELLQEKQTLMKKVKENELHYMDLCKNILDSKALAEAERSELNVQIGEMKAEIQKQCLVISQLQEQACNVKLDARREREKLELCLVKQEEKLNTTLAELQRSREDLERLRTKKVEELAELEKQVKVAIEKKDEMIWSLRNQLENAHHQIQHTEELLQQEHSILFH